MQEFNQGFARYTVERHLAGINFVAFVKSFVAFVLKDFNTKITKEYTKLTGRNAKSMALYGIENTVFPVTDHFN